MLVRRYLIFFLVLVAVGVWLEVLGNVIVLAGEGAVIAFAKVLPVKFDYLKVVFDCLLVASAAALSWWGLGQIVGIGEGTLAAALCTGFIVRGLNKWILGR